MKKLIRLLFRLFLFAFVIIAGIATVKTIAFSSKQIPVAPIEAITIGDEVPQRLAQAIRFQTISNEAGFDSLPFYQLDTFLQTSFPNVDSLLEKQRISALSTIYKWAGKNPKLAPILLTAHQDVVPVSAAEEENWTVPPFSGKIEAGMIWGRGAIDDKNSLLGILEAVELLLKEGYQPERSIYFAFGHDEEIGGNQGAEQAAAYFKQHDIHFDFVLDEGQLILESAMGGLSNPLAMIGITEKGYITLTLTANLTEGGHSSMPPPETAIGILSEAIKKLQDNPFPARIDGATAAMFDFVGPEMGLPYQVIFANRWLTDGLLLKLLSGGTSTNAIIRTTTAPTMLRGGIKDNVLPTRASAKVNFRILPGETIDDVVDRVQQIIADDRIIVAKEADPKASVNPSPVSDINAFGFQVIQTTIQQIFPDVVVAPSLVIGQTDGRHFVDVSDQVYRFMPIQLTKDDLKRFHGVNEQISVEGYKRMVRFYRQLILNSCK